MLLGSTLMAGELLTLTTSTASVDVADGTVVVVASAADVIHSNACPVLAYKSDCVPARYTCEVGMLLSACGSLYGQCSELCGTLHGFMALGRVVL